MSSAVLDQVSSNLAAPQSKEPTPIEKETMEAPVVESKRNDDSNPQQGTGKNMPIAESSVPPPVTRVPAQRASLKIPPTAKDDRKLFVGGLPSDSKFTVYIR